jgi:ubiquinone biosynthesis protein UbiJ
MVKLDLKTIITLATLLFAIAGFYYTTNNSIISLSLEVKGLHTENRDIRKRLDTLDKRVQRLNKQIRALKQ